MAIKSRLLNLSIIFILISSGIASDEKILRRPGTIECRPLIQHCYYISQNITALELIGRINKSLFPFGNLFDDGHFNSQSKNELVFWLDRPEILEKVKLLIPLLDTFEDYETVPLVKITTEIFSTNSEGLSSIRATIASRESTSTALFTDEDGSFNIPINIGNSIFSAIIGGEISRKRVKRVESITQLIPNLSSLNYKNTTIIYVPTPTSTKEDLAGLSIRGEVSINKNNANLIRINNYSLTYGVVDRAVGTSGEDRVNGLDIHLSQLDLTKGLTHLVVQSNIYEQKKVKGGGIFSFFKNSDVIFDKLLIVTRAETISYDTYIRELEKVKETELHGKFTKEERENFPPGEIQITEVLKSIHPYSFWTTSGIRVVGFKLDSKLARFNNIKENIKISIKGGGPKQKKVLSVENLMKSGIRLRPFSGKSLLKSYIKIKISLRPFHKKKSIKHVLFFNPDTNEFIK